MIMVTRITSTVTRSSVDSYTERRHVSAATGLGMVPRQIYRTKSAQCQTSSGLPRGMQVSLTSNISVLHWLKGRDLRVPVWFVIRSAHSANDASRGVEESLGVSAVTLSSQRLTRLHQLPRTESFAYSLRCAFTSRLPGMVSTSVASCTPSQASGQLAPV